MDINKDKELVNETEDANEIPADIDNSEEVTSCAEANVIEPNESEDDSALEFSDVQESEISFDSENFDDYESLDKVNAEVETPSKKSFPIQKPILIAMISFVLAVIIGFGSLMVYDFVTKKNEELTMVGVWAPAADVNSGYYYIFGEDGTFSVNMGGQNLTGSYLCESVEIEDTTSETGELVTYDIVTLTPCVFSEYENQAVAILSEDKNTLALNFIYSGTVELVRTELPSFSIDGSVITHASADELGITTLSTDDKIIGSWTTSDFTGVKETYTFFANGTGYCTDEFIDSGYSITIYFKYTVVEDKILITINLFNGNSSDAEINYYTDKGKLILNNLAYEAVK